MSRLYFHSPSGGAELLGSEYAWLRHLAHGPAEAAWDLGGTNGFERAVEIIAMIPEVPDGEHGSNYLHTYLREALDQDRLNKGVYAAWAEAGAGLPGHTNHEPHHRLVAALQTRLRVNGADLHVAGVELRSANVDLNTALIAGSDPIRLAAKLSGWGESHCWFDGPDRSWLADLIDEGLTSGLYRRGLWYADRPDGPKGKWSPQGWEDVAAFLRSRDDEPVVLSYSVGDSFPNREVAGWEPTIDPDWRPDWATDHEGLAEWEELSGGDRDTHRRDAALDRWYDLPDGEQWSLAMAGLKRERPWAQITPDNLATTTFHYPVTVYDLFASDRDDRVRAAVATVDGEPAVV